MSITTRRPTVPPRRPVPRLVALLAATFGCWGCADKNPPRPRNVLLVSIDSLRADHLGCYGYPRDTSPTIDRLAREGVRFANALTPNRSLSHAPHGDGAGSPWRSETSRSWTRFSLRTPTGRSFRRTLSAARCSLHSEIGCSTLDHVQLAVRMRHDAWRRWRQSSQCQESPGPRPP